MKFPSSRRSAPAAIVLALLAGLPLVALPTVKATLITLPAASLSAPTLDPGTIVDFGEVSLNTPIVGQTIKGFGFAENFPGATVSAAGPGSTLNLTSPSLQSGGGYAPLTYALTVTMPYRLTSFGFGFAILNTEPTANAVTITVFDGLTNLGALTYPGAPDPIYDGGFAGIGSTIPFTSARIIFGPSAAAFAIDNLAAVPEPGSVALYLFGGAMVGLRRGRRASRS